MSEQKLPVVAGKSSIKKELDKGTYYWCSCGLSKAQPFCDGSHQGSAFSPLAFEVTEKKNVSLCCCKQSKQPPYCDGTHKLL